MVQYALILIFEGDNPVGLGRRKSEVGSQKSEVRGRKSEDKALERNTLKVSSAPSGF